MKLYKVENHPDLVRDMNSKAILNTNYIALQEYKKKKQMTDELETLKSDVSEMKELLKSVMLMLHK